jgi:hypothetical protein
MFETVDVGRAGLIFLCALTAEAAAVTGPEPHAD